jgi:hypothetical protein
MFKLAPLALFPCLAFGQALDNGTVDVYFQQISSAGRLEGCSLVFTALEADTAYLRGKQIIMNGSLAVRTLSPSSLFFTGKLGTRPFDQSTKWQEPEHFYFSTANGSTAGTAKVAASDTKGYRLLIAQMDEPVMTVIREMVETREFTVGFNRKPGGQDVYTTIKIATSLRKDATGVPQKVFTDETAKSFAGCLSRLADSLAK